MRIWCISDTHGKHWQLITPPSLDAIIVAGDYSNSRDRLKNYGETHDFLSWLDLVPCRDKIVVAGNHDIYTEYDRRIISEAGIEGLTYLEHSVGIIGKSPHSIKVFGSPYTPSFGQGWAFNRSSSKLDAYWQEIPPDIDILVTHGPPKGILDLSHNIDGHLEYCGDKALLNHVLRIRPRYHIFGHIHNTPEGDINHGIRQFNNLPITFVNASCVTDREFDKGPSSNGVVIEFDNI